MILKIFSTYDSKVEAYGSPWVCVNRGAAIRAFSHMLKDKNQPAAMNPEDFTLYEIGTFDDQTSAIVNCNPTSCGTALELMEV